MDIVGYTSADQKTTSPYNIITFQWENVDGSDIYLNNFVVSSVAGTAYNHGVDEEVTPGWQNAAPQIQVRNSLGGYAIRYYADDAWDDANEKSVAGWADEAGTLDVDTKLSLGGGAWIYSPVADTKITTSGAIVSEETAVGGDTTQYILVGGAYPVFFKINDKSAVTWTLTPGTAYNHNTEEEVTEGWYLKAPQIQVRNNLGGYAIRYYADDAWDEANEEGVAGWADESGTLDVDTLVTIGGGFWLKDPANKPIYVTVKNPVIAK